MRKVIIVEFNGLPGSGKSTIARSLLDSIVKDNYNVVSSYKRFFWQRYLLPCFVIPYDWKLYSMISRYAKTVFPSKKRSHIVHPVHFCRMYEDIYKTRDIDFAIIDQGIIQAFVSIGDRDKLPHSRAFYNIVEAIKNKGCGFIRVDCYSDLNTTIGRMLSREKTGLYLESFSKESIKEILNVQIDNFEYVRSVFNEVIPEQKVISINTSNPVDENVKLIKDFIQR